MVRPLRMYSGWNFDYIYTNTGRETSKAQHNAFEHEGGRFPFFDPTVAKEEKQNTLIAGILEATSYYP